MGKEALADTRQKLIDAGITLFGRKGRDGVSTRELARAAGVNIAGIAYHFGGKDRLHVACAEHIATTVRTGIGRRLYGMPEGLPPAERLGETLAAVAEFMLATPETAAFARFVLREQMDPSPAFEVLFSTVMEPMHARLCLMWSEASGEDPEAPATKLRVFGLLSQIFMFRLAEAGILRRLDWRGLGPAELALIIANVKATCAALLASRRQEILS